MDETIFAYREILFQMSNGIFIYGPNDMQISSHPYHCEYLYMYLKYTLCYNMYICSIFVSEFIDVYDQTILKCSNGRTDFIPEMLNPNG
jgi:hypothetical protein